MFQHINHWKKLNLRRFSENFEFEFHRKIIFLNSLPICNTLIEVNRVYIFFKMNTHFKKKIEQEMIEIK